MQGAPAFRQPEVGSHTPPWQEVEQHCEPDAQAVPFSPHGGAQVPPWQLFEQHSPLLMQGFASAEQLGAPQIPCTQLPEQQSELAVHETVSGLHPGSHEAGLISVLQLRPLQQPCVAHCCPCVPHAAGLQMPMPSHVRPGQQPVNGHGCPAPPHVGPVTQVPPSPQVRPGQQPEGGHT
jgi:hypothetical protein